MPTVTVATMDPSAESVERSCQVYALEHVYGIAVEVAQAEQHVSQRL